MENNDFHVCPESDNCKRRCGLKIGHTVRFYNNQKCLGVDIPVKQEKEGVCCPVCHGDGVAVDEGLNRCFACSGSGIVPLVGTGHTPQEVKVCIPLPSPVEGKKVDKSSRIRELIRRFIIENTKTEWGIGWDNVTDELVEKIVKEGN